MKNKKLIICLSCLVVILVVIFGLLFSLNSKEKKIEETAPPTTEVIIEDTKLILKGSILDRYKDIEASDISKFLATLIVKVKPEEYQDFNYPVISTAEENSNITLALMHIDSKILDEYAVAVSLNNTSAYTVGVFKSLLGYEEELMSNLHLRISDLRKSLKNYPDQLYLVDNCILEQVGDYIVLIICDNQDKVYDEIFKVMKNLDLSTVISVPMLTDAERESIEAEAYSKEEITINSTVEEVIVTPVEEKPESSPSLDPENIIENVEDIGIPNN